MSPTSITLTIMELFGYLKYLSNQLFKETRKQEDLLKLFKSKHFTSYEILQGRHDDAIRIFYGRVTRIIEELRYTVTSNGENYELTSLYPIKLGAFVLYFKFNETNENHLAFVLHEVEGDNAISREELIQFANNSFNLHVVKNCISIIISIMNAANIHPDCYGVNISQGTELRIYSDGEASYYDVELTSTAFKSLLLTLKSIKESEVSGREMQQFLKAIADNIDTYTLISLWQIVYEFVR